MTLRLLFRMWTVPLAIASVVSGCAFERHYRYDDPVRIAALKEAWDQRKAFPPLPPLDYVLPPYAGYLRGWRVVLDPGHGGDAHREGYKRGPTNLREAEVNWEVAQFLEQFLVAAGADVRLTRSGDVDVGLIERAEVANTWPADVFVSLHHNAADRVTANYTTVWYHGRPDDEPANLDVARYLAHSVAEVLRLPETSANPLKSDLLMYPQGFGVLRALRVPGCLVEASFFTHPAEEQRLRSRNYRKREAYGLFLGLARYAWAGRPHSVLIRPTLDTPSTSKLPQLQVRLFTGHENRKGWATEEPWIQWDSVRVRLNGNLITHHALPQTGVVCATPDFPLRAGTHTVHVRFRNDNGNATRSRHEFTVDPPPAKVRLELATPVAPATTATVFVTVVDTDGDPVLDGTEVVLGAVGAQVVPTHVKTVSGAATAAIVPRLADRRVTVCAISRGCAGWIVWERL